MGIPKRIHTKFRIYSYIKQVNDKLFLYEDTETKSKITFSKYELGLIDNKQIDRILEIKPKKKNRLVVHDKLTDKEIELFNSQTEVAEYIGVSCMAVNNAIKERKWIKKRYFVEYKEEK